MRHMRRDRHADRGDVVVGRVPPAGRVAAPPRQHRGRRHSAQQADRRLAIAREDPVVVGERVHRARLHRLVVPEDRVGADAPLPVIDDRALVVRAEEDQRPVEVEQKSCVDAVELPIGASRRRRSRAADRAPQEEPAPLHGMYRRPQPGPRSRRARPRSRRARRRRGLRRRPAAAAAGRTEISILSTSCARSRPRGRPRHERGTTRGAADSGRDARGSGEVEAELEARFPRGVQGDRPRVGVRIAVDDDRRRRPPEARDLHQGSSVKRVAAEHPQQLVRERHVARPAPVRRAAARVDATNRLCVEADADGEAEAAAFTRPRPIRRVLPATIASATRRGAARIARQPERARKDVRPAAGQGAERNVRGHRSAPR